MKAKVIETGEIIDAVMCLDDPELFIYKGTYYQKSDLEFLPDTPEVVTIEGYVARDKSGPTDLGLRIYTAYPKRMEGLKRWNGKEAKSVLIDHRLFPEVTWESEPLKVKLTLTPME